MNGRIVAYLPSYVTSATHGYDISATPADKLSHLVYAFAGFERSGSDWVVQYPEPNDPTRNFPALAELKQRWQSLQVLISIGGWAKSHTGDPSMKRTPVWSALAANDHARRVFVQSCIDRFIRPSVAPVGRLFDGIDLDWEYPSPTDRPHLSLLLAEFRRQLDAQAASDGRHYALTLTIGTELSKVDLPAAADSVDWFNLMAYLAHSPNRDAHNQSTDFNSPLYPSPLEPPQNVTWDIDTTVSALAAEVASSQIVLGLNAYARTYAGVANIHHGVYQPYSGPGPGMPTGVLAYRDMVHSYMGASESHFDAVTRSAYLYNPTTRVWMSFDGTRSAREKADYANQHNLGGLMLWEVSADAPPPPRGGADQSLIDAMYARLQRAG